VIYSPAVLDAVAAGGVHSAAHITGGGLAANLARSLPLGLGAEIDIGAWERPDVFHMISERGVAEEEMRRTFNLGIGFCLVVDLGAEAAVSSAVSLHDPVTIGAVTDRDEVVLV
jgi:phosphoribosylformylglycinamidine cyclo-ligase